MHPWFHLLASYCAETYLDLIGSRHSRRRQIRALRHLDDHLLCDIGLTRRGIRLPGNMPDDDRMPAAQDSSTQLAVDARLPQQTCLSPRT